MSDTLQPTIEVAVYTVHDPVEGRRLREEAYILLSRLQGFMSWDRLVASDDPHHFVDVVHWSTHDDAQNASKQVQTDARFAPFVAAIDQIISFRHYRQDQ